MKALVIKQPWVDYILNGKKTWEIRGSNTKIRGKIFLIRSGSGLIVGSCELIDSIPLSMDMFQKESMKHCIQDINKLPYKNTYAWVLANAQRFEKPIKYKHPKGAIIRVNV